MPSGAVINADYIVLDKLVFDPEIAFIQQDTFTYVFLAYYKPDAYGNVGPFGHFYDIYLWEETTLSPVSLNNALPSLSHYSRISIDALDLTHIAITWEGPTNNIYMKLFSTESGTLTSTPAFQILLPPGAFYDNLMPDVALTRTLSEGNQVRVRVAYMYRTLPGLTLQNLYVISSLFDPLILAVLPGTVSWQLDDINLSAMEKDYSAPDFGNASWKLQLDCPDYSEEPRWAYSYHREHKDIRVRIKSGLSTTPFTIANITTTYLPSTAKYGMALAYDNDYNIHLGWGDQYGPNLLAVSYGEDGLKIGPGNQFKIIQNPPNYFQTHMFLAFSKQNTRNSHLFAAYNMAYNALDHHSGAVRTKLVPWSATTFSSKQEEIRNFKVYPNPFSSAGLYLDLPVLESGYRHEMSVYTLSGQELWKGSGDAGLLQSGINATLRNAPSGMYLMHYSNDFDHTLQVQKLTKN